ncbi:MAG: SBBP repeat-containing protein [Nitrososphaerota archaeon]
MYIAGEILCHGIPPTYPTDYATLKYNSDGILQWFRIYGNQRFDVPQAIAVDNFNNIYVTGWGDDFSCFLTIKYNSNGEEEWVKRDSNGKWASGIAVSKDNYIYITGWNHGSYVTMKYNSNGNKEWEVNYPAHAFYLELPKIAIDTFGNVYVAGVCNNDYLTIKYNRNGQILWVRTYNGPGNGYDRVCGLAVDNLGNVYITGLSEGDGTNFDYATIKYNANGVEEWVKRYNDAWNGPDSARAIAVDDSGNVYVTGTSWNGLNMDYLTIKYTQKPDRVEDWIIRYNGPDNLNDYAFFLSLDNYGNIYVSGVSYSTKQGIDYTTIKYIQTGCGIRTEEKHKFLLNNSILKIYPNPAKNIVYIQGPLLKKEIKIFDISGNLIKVLYIEENKKNFPLNLNNIKEGIYFIKIDNKQEKLIIQK